eukprot:scaffold188_cov107-Isochrysis_galbana.AAC.11
MHSNLRTLESENLPQCALVSTAGSLLGKMHGRDIDAHQEVIRLGQGPTGGRFLEDVGSRTTLRITNAYLFVPSHNNLSMFGTTLQSEGWPRLACLNRHCPVQKEGCSRLFTCIRLPRCADHLPRGAF